MKKKNKQPLEFSKVIAIVMLTIFVLTFFVAWFTYIVQDKVSTDLLNFIATPLSVIITGYFVKAGTENFQKINRGEEPLANTPNPDSE